MATVIFYEKLGCANNMRQKMLLSAAGHLIIVKNLLEEKWQAETLKPFFIGLPVRDWFNYSAPAIKQGEIEPDKLDEQQALSLMLENPLLIRRPLMQVGSEYMAGFDQEKVQLWLGLAEQKIQLDLESCRRSASSGACSHD